MVTVTSINVDNRYGTSFLVVTWNVTVPDGELLSDYQYYVYRSLTSEEEYVKINTVPISSLIYQDNTVNLLDNTLKYYYKIEAENKNTLETQLSTVYGSLTPGVTDAIADTIIYQEQYLLQHIIHENNPDRKVKILLRRRAGTRCPVCWDDIKKQTTKSYCLTCYGTGYDGGYFSPISVYVSANVPASRLKVDINEVRPLDEPFTAWMGNYPLLLNDDIIVDHINNRFRVIDAQQTVRRTSGYVIRQNLTLQRLPFTDIVYKFSVE